MKQQKRTLRTIVLVIAITLLTKVLGVVREALQARVFGTALSFDLYTISYNNSIYIFTTVAYALCVAAVPIISKKLEHDRESAFRSAGNLLCVSLVASLVLTALLTLVVQFAPVANFLNVAPAHAGTLRTYLQICVLTLPLIVLIYLLVSVFQSMEHYTLQGSLSLPYNILLIVFLALFARGDHMLEYILVVCFAWVLQLAMTFPCWVQEKFRFYPSLRFNDPDVKLFFRTTVVTVFTTSIFLWCYLADSATVTRFGDGAVSAVYYADKLFTPVATTLIYSISVVLFPKYNQEYSRVSEREYKKYVGGTVENTLFVILPFSAMFMIFAVPIIHVLFEGGNFNAASTAMTSSMFAMYSIGMAGFCVLDLINKAYYTMGKTLIPLLINALVLGANLVLNAIFRSSESGGTIAMMTAAALTAGGLVALICFFKNASGTFNAVRAAKDLIAAGVMSAVLFALTKLLYTGAQSKLIVLLEFLALGVLGIGIYAAVCWALREREALDLILSKFRKRVN